jgi:ubiquinone/menaquinone biosynthesis C-methylase UbiE
MSEILSYGAAESVRVTAISQTPEVLAQRRRVISLLAPATGERILDVGCGPGDLAREITSTSKARVWATDISEQMLAIAAEHPTTVELSRASVLCLPFAECSFDAITATQMLEFVADLGGALAELHRVLAPGGRLLILDTDWDSLVWHSTDPARMRHVLEGWRSLLADSRLPRTLSPALRNAGFEIQRREVFTIFDPLAEERSYSSHQIDHLAAAVERSAHPAGASVGAWAKELRELALRGEYFFSLNRYIFLASKANVEASARLSATV